MSPSRKRPDIERITNRYVDAWENFGYERFSASDLETELLRAKDPEDVPDESSINQDLYRISMLGVVEWYGDREFKIAISPDENDSDWSEEMQEQTSWVRSEIDSRVEERREPEETESELDNDPDILQHDDQKYLSAFVGPSSDIDGQARYYQAALSPNKHDGVVLRSYQNVAKSTDELANEITDDEKMDDTECIYRFEAADEQVVEVDDGLEYRVYLDETRLLSSS
ncbi:hypothetical protein [Natranaeroarchaeum aerophilus]|uniref:Uncharacterized protein n=1 Tax=Natranaeroarchaeum aerophilus TaxID=2917711 RepID=A0AAE3FTY3_9EURY|nr:hypothetical protein [Natranaeroarchaeum aerophilus]MCL9815091.1 hypothetical protein [Natranaeroarchaeum aerophilus]